MIPTILHFIELFVTVVLIISNFFFPCNFFNKLFANILFSVRATYFAGTTNPTSRCLFPATIASSLFSGAAFKKYVGKQGISFGRCPTNVSLSPHFYHTVFPLI